MGENEAAAIKQPPRLFAETQQIIAEIENRLNAPLLCYWNSLGGSIYRNDVLALYRILEHAGRHEPSTSSSKATVARAKKPCA